MVESCRIRSRVLKRWRSLKKWRNDFRKESTDSLAQARIKSAAGDFAGALNDAKQAQAAAPSDAQKQAIKGLIDRLEVKQDINK